MLPTNPSYIRKLVMLSGQFESVRVSPSTGAVSVKEAGQKWRVLGTTKTILEAEMNRRAAKRMGAGA